MGQNFALPLGTWGPQLNAFVSLLTTRLAHLRGQASLMRLSGHDRVVMHIFDEAMSASNPAERDP